MKCARTNCNNDTEKGANGKYKKYCSNDCRYNRNKIAAVPKQKKASKKKVAKKAAVVETPVVKKPSFFGKLLKTLGF